MDFWLHRGFRVDRTVPHGMILAKRPAGRAAGADGRRHAAPGERLAALLRPGDLVIATGDLGAGKTTLTQGIGRGLGSAGPVISPTFVLSRIHPSTTGRPRLVHVDAYRLGGPAELDDLDLDATVADSVTVVEWGQGVAEGLADDRLEIDIWRSPHDGDQRPDASGWSPCGRSGPAGPPARPRRPGEPGRMTDRAGPRPGHRDGGQRRAGPGRAGAGRGARSTDRMAHAEQLMPLVARLPGPRRRPTSPTSTRSWSASVPARSPACGSGWRPPRSWPPVTGVALHGVCSLDVLAAEHAATGRPAEFVVATDARRREVYWARYAADGTRLTGPAGRPAGRGAAAAHDRPGRRPLPRPADAPCPGPARLDPA